MVAMKDTNRSSKKPQASKKLRDDTLSWSCRTLEYPVKEALPPRGLRAEVSPSSIEIQVRQASTNGGSKASTLADGPPFPAGIRS
jgi:hypothetical protein